MEEHQMNVDVAVCILFYEKVEQTIECIKSFLPAGKNIYVLNNHSSIDARTKLGNFTEKYPIITVFDVPENLGVGRGRNFLIDQTKEEWLFFVDNDITVKNLDWLADISAHIQSEPAVEAWVPRLYNIHEERYVTFSEIVVKEQEVTTIALQGDRSNTFPGGASVVARSLFSRLGQYDQEMFVGLEDFELAVRGIVTETPIYAKLIQNVELVHDHKTVSNSVDASAVRIRYDEEKIQQSFDRLQQKHQLKFEHEWRDWVAEQRDKMIQAANTDLPADSLVVKIKNTFNKLFGASEQKKIEEITTPPRIEPKSCTLYMTDICNFSCAGCSRSILGVKKEKEMSLQIVEKVIQEYPSLTGFCVAGLGEPTLCSQFPEIVDHIKSKQKYVGIITNGSTYAPFTKLHHKPDYVSISLYGYNDESYRAYCGLPVFDTVMKTYHELKAQGIETGFSYILNRSNYQSLQPVIELCDKLEPDFLNLLNYLVYDPAIKEEREKVITLQDTEIIQWIDKVTQDHSYVALKPHYLKNHISEQQCRSYYEVLNVDGAGNIGGCQRQIAPDAKYGNLFTDKDPFNSLEMQAVRQKISCKCFPHSECRLCFGNSIKE